MIFTSPAWPKANLPSEKPVERLPISPDSSAAHGFAAAS